MSEITVMSVRTMSLLNLLLILTLEITAQQWPQSQADFVDQCTKTYNGVVNGGRCFYLAFDPGASSNAVSIGGRTYYTMTWQVAFEFCQRQGGVFAQIHTSSEWKAITDFFQVALADNQRMWIAVNRDSPHPVGNIDLSTTYWYNADGSKNSLLTAQNTYFRNHRGDEPSLTNDGEACFNLKEPDGIFADWPCSKRNIVLCSVTNEIQKFDLVSDKCMNETVLKTSSVSGMKECAIQCAQEVWCRSFNVINDCQQCDLFSWHYDDTSNVVAAVDCIHYAYAP